MTNVSGEYRAASGLEHAALGSTRDIQKIKTQGEKHCSKDATGFENTAVLIAHRQWSFAHLGRMAIYAPSFQQLHGGCRTACRNPSGKRTDTHDSQNSPHVAGQIRRHGPVNYAYTLVLSTW